VFVRRTVEGTATASRSNTKEGNGSENDSEVLEDSLLEQCVERLDEVESQAADMRKLRDRHGEIALSECVRSACVREHSRMTTQNSAYASFAREIRGKVICSGDRRYDDLRKPWLQIVDQHPALIVEAASADDIVASVHLARERGLVLGVMSTGHGIAAPCDGGLLLRLSNLTHIEIDTAQRTARVEPGVVSRDLLTAAHKHGLAYAAGQVSNVGVVGYTLGGGMGWLVRKLGGAADTIMSADVVLANGSLVRASVAENPDLFWALRGGGGNFGIVVSLQVALAPIDHVVGGERYYPLDRAGDIMRFYRAWSSSLGEDTSTIFRLVAVPPDESAPPPIRGTTCCVIGLCHADPDTADAVLAPLEQLGKPLVDSVKRCTVADMDELDPASHSPGAPAYGQVEFLKELSDDVIDGLVHLAHTLIPPLMLFEVQQLGGALTRVSTANGAFRPSQAPYLLHLESPAIKTPMAEIANKTHDAFAALGDAYTGEKYYNFLRGDEAPLIEHAFGAEKFARLREIKRTYDPTNLFHLNLNVTPA